MSYYENALYVIEYFLPSNVFLKEFGRYKKTCDLCCGYIAYDSQKFVTMAMAYQ